MAALTDVLSRRGEILVLVLVCVLSIGLISLSSGSKASVVRAVNDAAMTPVQSAISGLQGLAAVRTENDSLRAELARARVEIAELDERSRSAARLERMLSFRDRSRFDLVAARVVAQEAGRLGRELKIDIGSLDGVKRNLAVIGVDGLVGKVSAVEPRSAFVRPITGRQCRVSARVRRSRVEGILDWSPEHGLNLGFLPLRADVRPGDEIVSSGLGDVYPGGIAIGRITEVQSDPSAGQLRVLVAPAQDFRSLEEVFVVTAAREVPPDSAAVGPAGDAAPGSPSSDPALPPEGD